MPTRQVQDLEGLIQMTYRAAVDTSCWPDVLTHTADQLGGSSAWLSELDNATGEGNGITARIDPVMPVLYREHYATLNPFPSAGLSREAGAMRRCPTVLLASDLIDDAELVHGEYYNGFMRPQDVHAVLIIRLATLGRMSVAININRPRSWGPFARRHLIQAEALAEHLARAFHLGKTMGTTRTAPDNKPTIVVDAACQARHVNAKAEHLLDTQRGVVGLSRGNLSLVELQDNERLRQTVARAAGGATGGVIVSSGLILSVSPLPAAFSPIFAPDALALVVFDSLRTDAGAAQAVFVRALGLTPAESRVAYAFLTGDTPRDIALRFGVSPNTVRVQFAHIFTKAAVTRQADLARLLDRLVVAGE